MTTIAAIDPGANGGIAWTCVGVPACCRPMPKTEGDVIALIRHLADMGAVFYIEDLVKFAGNAGTSSGMAVYASNWGFIKGAIQFAGRPLHIVNPRTWAKSMGLGTRGKMTKTEWKNKLKARAQQLYPQLSITLATSDALLLLTHAVRDHVKAQGGASTPIPEPQEGGKL